MVGADALGGRHGITEPDLKLNILALPNQVIIIVVMLALVIFSSLLAIGINGLLIFPAIAIFLLLLSFRQVLATHERNVRLGLHLAGPTYAPLQSAPDAPGDRLHLGYRARRSWPSPRSRVARAP